MTKAALSILLLLLTLTLMSCSNEGPSRYAGTPSANSSTPSTSDEIKTTTSTENPAIALSVTPSKGSLAGGYSILLVGTGFTSGMSVKVGGSPCTSLTVLSANQISCKVPAHAAGNVNIETITAGGSTNTFNSAFTYSIDTFSQVDLFAGSLDPMGTANGSGSAARFNSPRGIASDGTNLYVADMTNQIIRSISISTGTVSIFAGTTNVSGGTDGIGEAARFTNPVGLAIDPALQNLYVADGGHTIRKIAISTREVTTIAGLYNTQGTTNGIGSAARFRSPNALVATATDLYVSDTGNHTIRQVALSNFNVTTLAGAAGTAAFADGNAGTARFNQPSGITIDGNYLYLADYGNSRIRQIQLTPSVAVATIAGSTAGLVDNTTGTLARLNNPYDVYFLNGYLYVADFSNHVIRRVMIATVSNPGWEVSTIVGSFPTSLAGSKDGTGSAARFSNPARIVAVNGSLYVTDGNQSVRQVNLSNNQVSTFAGLAEPSGYIDSNGIMARFTSPRQGVVYNGKMYVNDSGTYTIRQIDLANGEVSLFTGTPLTTGTVDGGKFTGRLSSPYGMAVDTSGGMLYITDLTHTIRKVNLSTGDITTLAGSPGTAGTTNGIGMNARFNTPYSLAYVNGFLYIADTSNHSIRKLNLSTLEVTTLAGLNGTAGAVDGAAGSARFNSPRGIVADNSGTYLYVSDFSNHVIRKVEIATGTVSTHVGTLGSFGYSDGVSALARFYQPSSLTTDGTHLYLYDGAYCVLRKIHIASASVTTLMSSPSLVACNDVDGTIDVGKVARPTGLHWASEGLFLVGNHGIRRMK